MKPKIVICMGSSCFSRGNEENLKVVEDFWRLGACMMKRIWSSLAVFVRTAAARGPLS